MNYFLNSLTKFALVFLAIIVAVSSFVAQAPSEKSTKQPTVYALSIGIDKLEINRHSLQGAKRDAGFVSDRIAFAFNKTAKLEQTFLFDESATREGILRALDSFARNSTPEDIVFFTYSGHGTQLETAGGMEGSLVPFDFGVGGTQGIRASELLGQFRKIRAKTKVVLIDGDNFLTDAKSALSAFTESSKSLADLIQENYLIIGPNDKGHVFEDEFIDPRTNKLVRFGSLSYFFAEGLGGSADKDGSRTVDSKELEIYVTSQIKKSYPIKKSEFKYAEIIALSSGVFDINSGKRSGPSTSTPPLRSQPNITSGSQGTPPVQNAGALLTRADVYMPSSSDKGLARKGDDYALLFANDVYDNDKWTRLQNPKNDVSDIAKELKERYGFKEVDIKANLTTQEIYDTIEAYTKKTFEKPDDQLFVFFAGHGVTDVISNEVRSGYYVGRDSPHPFTRKDNGRFVQLDRLLTLIDIIPVKYSLAVFDACFAGQIWKPSVQLISDITWLPDSNPYYLRPGVTQEFGRAIGKMMGGPWSAEPIYQEVSRGVYAKRKMKNRSRIIITSGDRPVADAFVELDGTLSRNSPFADAFLRALRTGGGDDGVLITAEVIPFIDKLIVEPQKGRLSGSDGDFVFVSTR